MLGENLKVKDPQELRDVLNAYIADMREDADELFRVKTRMENEHHSYLKKLKNPTEGRLRVWSI